jgi:hypothetical protein
LEILIEAAGSEMHSKRKPDLLIVLAFIVGFGILFSAFTDDALTPPQQNIIINTSALDSSVRLSNPYQGELVNVTHSVRVTEDKKVTNKIQLPNHLLQKIPSLKIDSN